MSQSDASLKRPAEVAPLNLDVSVGIVPSLIQGNVFLLAPQ